jgi:hypothetical protein
LWLLIGPVFAYLNIGQAKKIEIIRGFYSPDLIARHFDQFWRGRDGFAASVRRWRAQRPNLSPDLTAELAHLIRRGGGCQANRHAGATTA